MARKKIEKRCLHITKSNLQWFRRYHNISGLDQERPDFILSDGTEEIGLEHFLIDTLWDNGSQSRKTAKCLELISTAYKKQVNDEIDTVSGIADVVIDCMNAYKNFSYDTFINNFRRVFNKHLSNISTYKKNGLNKIGFLIEISVFDFDYIINERDGSSNEEHIKGIPFTYDMWDIINQFDDVDFVIVTVLKINSNKNKSYYFDKTHIPNELHKSFAFNIEKI